MFLMAGLVANVYIVREAWTELVWFSYLYVLYLSMFSVDIQFNLIFIFPIIKPK